MMLRRQWTNKEEIENFTPYNARSVSEIVYTDGHMVPIVFVVFFNLSFCEVFF